MRNLEAAGSEYDARIQRAEKLIVEKSAASEILSFYRHIAGFQKSIAGQIAGVGPEPKVQRFGSIRDGPDLTLLLPHFRAFLAVVEQNAPKVLAEAAREMAERPSDFWVTMLTEYWRDGGCSNQQIGAFEQ